MKRHSTRLKSYEVWTGSLNMPSKMMFLENDSKWFVLAIGISHDKNDEKSAAATGCGLLWFLSFDSFLPIC